MTEQITRKSLFRVIAWILVFCIMLTIFPLGARAEGATTQSVQRTTITDLATNSPTDYVDILGAADSTRYDGRVWVDKTVSDKNVEFTGDEDTKTFSVSKDEDEDFLVTYSALANTANIQINPEEQISDTIFVLDFSMTMNATMDGTNVSADVNRIPETRTYAMLNAMEETIQNLQAANGNNRVGIVTFYGSANVLLPLTSVNAIPPEVADKPEVGEQIQNKNVNYTTPDGYFSILDYRKNGNYTRSEVSCNIGTSAPTINGLSDYTNTHSGLYGALDMLRKAELKNGQNRQANVILISDGAPNSTGKPVTDRAWYEEVNLQSYDTIGDNTAPPIFAAVLMASYLKYEMMRKYGDCSIYTVGLTTGNTRKNMEVLLNPNETLYQGATGMAGKVWNMWLEYTDKDETYPKAEETTFIPVMDPNDSSNIIPSSLQYADAFYDADNADALADAFQKITAEIISGAKAPTDVPEGESPETSGYITFTDPLGEYMAVKDVKCIIFDDQQFTKKETTTADNKTTYTFTGTVDNPVYPGANVEDIIIEVSETDGQQTLTIKIPASVLPLRSNTVFLNSEDPDSAWKMTTKAHMPMRIVYSLGLQHDALETYLQENPASSNAEYADFYANQYDGTTINGDKTRGNATATFTAGTGNPFYYAQKGTALYVEQTDGTKDPATAPFSEQTDYYVRHDYYYMKNDQLKHDAEWTQLTDLTKQDVATEEATTDDGTTTSQLVLAQDVLKNVNLDSARSEKNTNETGTADYSYYATALAATDQTAEGAFLAYLGNNGKLSVPIPDPLTITVNKVWDDGNDQDGLRSEKITVSLLENAQATGQCVTLSESNGWENSFTIPVPDETAEYSVEEENIPTGYTSTVTGDAKNGFTITNSHTPNPVISVEKVWDDAHDSDGLRPESVTVALVKDGVATGETVTLDKSTDWKGSFTVTEQDLDSYTVVEENVPTGYTSTVAGDAKNGFIITNSYTPDPVISVEKVWDDAHDSDGLRPESVTVALVKDGVATGETVTLDKSTDWKGSFTVTEQDIDSYTVEEINVPRGYSCTITGDAEKGFSITNKHTPYRPSWPSDSDPDEPNTPDDLNTVDHFSYVVGYPEDYRTGEPTDNKDLWPVKPQGDITRAEVATIFYRLLKADVRDENTTDVSNFSDVNSSDWYGTTVATLADMGIVKGYEDGTFRPNAPITRAEFAAIATRFFEETGATYEPGTFTDITGDEWFAGAIMDAVNLGLIGGYEDGTVRPNNNITRAEACAIVNRTLGRVPDADHLLPEDEMKTWPDNPESAWFYADMQEATNGHEYEWITEDGNKVENWIDLLDKDWNDR